MDLYDRLGVSRDATREEIRRAYRRKASKLHPDKDRSAGAEERFKALGEAYEVLSDPEKRRLYDLYGERWREIAEGSEPRPGASRRRHARRSDPGPGAFGGDFGGGFGSGFGGGFGGFEDGSEGPFHQGSFTWTGDASPDVDELLRSVFGSGGPGGPTGASNRRSPIEITIPLRDALEGGVRTIRYPQGKGAYSEQVRLPAGVPDGARLRVGQRLLVVHVTLPEGYEVRGSDLVRDLPIAPWEAVLGGAVEFTHADGRTLRVTLPKGTPAGREMRLRGLGFTRPEGGRGDLILRMRIQVPPAPDPADEEEAKRWRDRSRFRPER